MPGCSQVACQEAVCSRCSTSRYCSRAHQMADRKRHRAVCANPAPSALTPLHQQIPREELRSVKVVLFPANGLPARIISVECQVETSAIYHGLREDWLDLRQVVGAPAIFAGAIGFTRRSSGRSSRLYLGVVDQTAPDNPVNYCIRRYTEGRDAPTWSGNAVGFRRREPTTKYMQYLDVTDDDIPAFVTYFREFGTSRAPAVPDVVLLQAAD
ncbi:hypothetical protein OH77DRAFT_1427940 [Trametes cingulata]|nr:hypothetical protein OH77DRAFT_1427940 [Trametes cingulata]